MYSCNIYKENIIICNLKAYKNIIHVVFCIKQSIKLTLKFNIQNGGGGGGGGGTNFPPVLGGGGGGGGMEAFWGGGGGGGGGIEDPL